jgi:hypothetical protein
MGCVLCNDYYFTGLNWESTPRPSTALTARQAGSSTAEERFDMGKLITTEVAVAYTSTVTDSTIT